MSRRRRLRAIRPPFVVAPPPAVRIRTRLFVSHEDEDVLREVGAYLGHLACVDLAIRCREGPLDAKARAASRRERKRRLTSASSSRWAGAITRTTEDAWQLAWRNVAAEIKTLRSRINRIKRRLVVPVGERRGRWRGYSTRAEHFEKQRRMHALAARLAALEARVQDGRVSICRGGRELARIRHSPGEDAFNRAGWRDRWDAARMFISADGEASKAWGNETIRWRPDECSLEIKLPVPLAYLANRSRGRYRLSCPVAFPYRGNEAGAQAATGAIRYDICFDTARQRWYLDASWKVHRHDVSLVELRLGRVVAVDLNSGHLAAVVVDESGNCVGAPFTIPLELSGLPASTRDGRLRAAVSELLDRAMRCGCGALVIEDLDFSRVRAEGREYGGRRPSYGARGRAFRGLVHGIPTARFRDRVVQMATNKGLSVIAVDAAYTSQWGVEHWLGALQQLSPDTNGHHGAALVIGRRALGQRARRRERCDSNPPEDG